LRPFIPGHDNSIQILADDRIVGILNNGRQPQGRYLRCPAFGDIPEDQNHAPQIRVAPANGRTTVINGPFGAIFRNKNSVIGQPHYFSLRQNFRHRVFDRLPREFVDNSERVIERHTGGFGCAPAREFLRHRIHERDAATPVRGDHGITNAR